MDAIALMSFALGVAMVSLRVGALVLVFPLFSQRAIPTMVKISFVMCLSVCLWPVAKMTLPTWSLQNPPTALELAGLVFREVFFGLGMGFVARLSFGAIAASASWVSSQIGFTAAQVMGLEVDGQDSAWTLFCEWMATILFLSIGGHTFFIEAMAESYKVDWSQLWPQLLDASRGFHFWSEVGSSFFLWILKLSAPYAFAVFILQMAMGILSRFIPQINVWMLSMPITIGFSIFFFAMVSPMYGDALHQVFEGMREKSMLWSAFLKGGGG